LSLTTGRPVIGYARTSDFIALVNLSLIVKCFARKLGSGLG